MDYFVTLFSGLMTIFGGGFAVFTYWLNSRLKHGEWLYQLYEKFYEGSHYKEMRQILDNYEDEELKAKLERLKNGIENNCEVELVESLVDYLNFFEFIASLWKLKQLNIKEIEMVFEYYILCIADHDFLNKYLVDNKFNNLPKLIPELKKTN